MRNREQEKKPNWLSFAVILLILAPEIAIPVAICGGIGYLVFTLVKKKSFHPPQENHLYQGILR